MNAGPSAHRIRNTAVTVAATGPAQQLQDLVDAFHAISNPTAFRWLSPSILHVAYDNSPADVPLVLHAIDRAHRWMGAAGGPITGRAPDGSQHETLSFTIPVYPGEDPDELAAYYTELATRLGEVVDYQHTVTQFNTIEARYTFLTLDGAERALDMANALRMAQPAFIPTGPTLRKRFMGPSA